MDARELRECLETIGWGEVFLWKKARVAPSVAGQWLANRTQVRPDIAEWLRFLRDVHLQNPPPPSRWPRRAPPVYGTVPKLVAAEKRKASEIPHVTKPPPEPPAAPTPARPFEQPQGWHDAVAEAYRRGSYRSRT
jgi:hypothetical protein